MVVAVEGVSAKGYSSSYYLARPNCMFGAEVRHLMGLAAVQPGDRVLELGCGGGDFLAACMERRRPSLGAGLDANSRAIALARHAAPGTALTVADASRLPFRDGAFHAVVAQHLIEHFERPDELLREWARVLAPGGRLAVATPNVMYPDAGLFEDPTHRHIYSRVGLRKLFERNGFAVERCHTLMPFLGNRRLTWTVARWFLRPLLAMRFLPYFRERGLSLLLGARKTQEVVEP